MIKLIPNESIKDKTIRLRFLVDAEVKENFGRCPNTHFFDVLVQQMRDSEAELKVQDPTSWIKYMDDFYGGNR